MNKTNKYQNYNILAPLLIITIFTAAVTVHNWQFNIKFPATIIGDEVLQRGSHFKANNNTLYTNSDTEIHLEKNTEIIITDSRTSQETWQLLVGRLDINGSHTVKINDYTIRINGYSTLTHYSWLNELKLDNHEGELIIQHKDQTVEVLGNKTLKTNSINPIEFSPEN
jgi:hypothetical protein